MGGDNAGWLEGQGTWRRWPGPAAMNWADWAIVAIFGLSVATSAMRGLIREALSLAIWLAAFVVAMAGHQQVAELLAKVITTPSLRLATAWLGLFFLVLIVGAMLNYVFGRLVDATGLSGTDRLLGMVFGAARGIGIVMALLILLPKVLPVNEDPWWRESLLIPKLLRFEAPVREFALTLYGAVERLF